MSLAFLKPESILTEGMQVRAKLSEETVLDYVSAMSGGAKFPPVTVFRDATGCWLADGFHRLEAWKRIGVQKIKAEVKVGGRIDALKFAFTANCTHGLRMTNEDKRNAVRMAYENRIALGLGEVPSANAVAKACGVSHVFVMSQLVTVTTWADALARQGTDGKTYKIPVPTRPKVDAKKLEAPPKADAPKAGLAVPVKPKNVEPVTLGTGEGSCGTCAPSKPFEVHPVLTDSLGQEVPSNLAELWTRRTEVQDNVKALQKVRLALKKAQDGNDPLWHGFNFSSALMHLDNALAHLKGAVPHCICVYCSGLTGGCKACHSGLMPLVQYERLPRELKK